MQRLKFFVRLAFLAIGIVLLAASSAAGSWVGGLTGLVLAAGAVAAVASTDKSARVLFRLRRKAIFIHIGYSDETMEAPTGAVLYDNRQGGRPDWREYWPMRDYLRNNRLSSRQLIGFFSPKFTAKTGLTYPAFTKLIASRPSDIDVFIVSPQPDMSALFPNVFLQGEFFDSGFLETARQFCAAARVPVNFDSLWMDSSTTVFSNYVLATPRFWKKWSKLAGILFDICEGPDTELRRALTFKTNYPGAVERKVFLMERLASLILTTDRSFRVQAINPFETVWSSTPLSRYRIESVACDALKAAGRVSGDQNYFRAYVEMRESVFKQIDWSQNP